MKIAVIIPSLANKAPIKVAIDIIEYLMQKGSKVDVYYFDDIIELKLKCNKKKISLSEEIDFHKYDIIHSHMLRPDFYLWLHKRKIRSANTITVSTLHNNVKDVLIDRYGIIIGKIFSTLWIYFLKTKDQVICLSNHAKNELENKYNLKNIDFIYNGRMVKHEDIDNNITNLLLSKKAKFTLLGVLANLTKIKGIEQIINILPLLENYCLIIAGDGPEEAELKNKVDSLNLRERCIFLGKIENAHSILEYIDIYMMTSYSEGFPLVLLEAAQYKKPIVCSDIPIFKEFFDNREVVFFELDNSNSLKSAIEQANSLKDSLANSVFKKYEKSYTLSIMGENYYQLFMRIKSN